MFLSQESSLRNDREAVLTAIQSRPRALQHASDTLRADRGIVLAALQHARDFPRPYRHTHTSDGEQGPLSLREVYAHYDVHREDPSEFMSDDLQGDPEVLVLQCEHTGRLAPVHIRASTDPEIWFNKRLLIGLLSTSKRIDNLSSYGYPDPHILPLSRSCLNSSLKEDRDLVVAALSKFAPSTVFGSGKDIPATFGADREIVRLMLARDASVLEHVSREFRADRDLVLLAMATDDSGGALEHVVDSLRADSEVVLVACRHLRTSEDEWHAECDFDSCSRFRNFKHAASDLQGDKAFVLR